MSVCYIEQVAVTNLNLEVLEAGTIGNPHASFHIYVSKDEDMSISDHEFILSPESFYDGLNAGERVVLNISGKLTPLEFDVH